MITLENVAIKNASSIQKEASGIYVHDLSFRMKVILQDLAPFLL